MESSRPQQCPVCHQIFATPQELTIHFNVVHRHFPTSSNYPLPAPAAPPAPARPHFCAVHQNNRNFSTSSNFPLPAPAAAPIPTNCHHNPYGNPNLGVAVRNHIHFTYYRRGYLDSQGRFRRGIPPAAARVMTPARRSNFVFEQEQEEEEEEEEKPEVMDLFPVTSSSSENGDGADGRRTLPLLCQLEHQVIPEEGTVMENVEEVDLTLRL